tara:strand:- start:216 stop:956 length:741 start_codon:yes stop_codon:yes gene_type:complete
MAMIEDQKEDQWWDLGTEGPEVKEEKTKEKTSSAWWWAGFAMIPALVVCSGIIAISDWGTNSGPHWQSSDHSYVEEFQLTYYNHTFNYTAHSIEAPNHIIREIGDLDFIALEIQTNNFRGELNTYYNFNGYLTWIDDDGRVWEAVVPEYYDDSKYTHSTELVPLLMFRSHEGDIHLAGTDDIQSIELRYFEKDPDNPSHILILLIWLIVPSSLFAKANWAQRESFGKGILALLLGIVTMPLMFVFS